MKRRLFLLIGGLLLLVAPPAQGQEAVWPPFWYDLIPTYGEGTITYQVGVYTRVDWHIVDLFIKIRIPDGTRFVSAQVQPGAVYSFEGQEISFFTASLNQYFEDTSFVVEVTDSTRTDFTAESWISWKGNNPGSYSSEPVTVSTVQQRLDWSPPPPAGLQVGAAATVDDDDLAYTLYPRSVAEERLTNIAVSLAVPAGTAFVSAGAEPPFEANFDGQAVTFTAGGMAPGLEAGPLSVRLSTAGVGGAVLTAPVRAAWDGGQLAMGLSLLQPGMSQRVTFDAGEDVPLAAYDLAAIAFREYGPILSVVFSTVGQVGPVGQAREYSLFIDSDCSPATGQPRQNRGAEWRLSYNHQVGRATLTPWSAALEDWNWPEAVVVDHSLADKAVVLSLRSDAMGPVNRFCWVGRSADRSGRYAPEPPVDWLPDGEYTALSQYEVSAGSGDGPGGLLAVPLLNYQNLYDVHIFSMPDGRELGLVEQARQPNFHPAGGQMLVNRDSGLVWQGEYYSTEGVYVLKNLSTTESIYRYNLAAETEQVAGGSPVDAFPFYNPQGSRLVYARPVTDVVAAAAWPTLFVQCGLKPPAEEESPQCQNLTALGSPVVAGGVWGNHPVWTAEDTIVYLGCDNWATARACGIYSLPVEGETLPTQLTTFANDIPGDTGGGLVAFTSFRDGDWEAYLVGLDGSGARNVSLSPASNDGLPTFSPDGQWVAFVSDRGGEWAVWAVPPVGGPAMHLFRLPAWPPWGEGELDWTNERISWGPG